MLKLLVLHRFLKENFSTPGGYCSLLPHCVGFQGAPGHFGIKGVQGDRGPVVGEATNYSRTSLIRKLKGQSEVSVVERCPYNRAHYIDVTFMTPLKVLSVQ